MIEFDDLGCYWACSSHGRIRQLKCRIRWSSQKLFLSFSSSGRIRWLKCRIWWCLQLRISSFFFWLNSILPGRIRSEATVSYIRIRCFWSNSILQGSQTWKCHNFLVRCPFWTHHTFPKRSRRDIQDSSGFSLWSVTIFLKNPLFEARFGTFTSWNLEVP